MSKSDGGAAFPSPGVAVSDGRRDQMQQGAYEGMTLRDYFAAKAAQGLLSGAMADGTKYHPDAAAFIAQAAYQMADTMLEERAK